jgi:hypothetical protein
MNFQVEVFAFLNIRDINIRDIPWQRYSALACYIGQRIWPQVGMGVSRAPGVSWRWVEAVVEVRDDVVPDSVRRASFVRIIPSGMPLR